MSKMEPKRTDPNGPKRAKKASNKKSKQKNSNPNQKDY